MIVLPCESPFTSSTTWFADVSGIRPSCSSRRRPTIMLMIVSIGVEAAGTVPMYCPSRITVTRSAIRFSSSILCEM